MKLSKLLSVFFVACLMAILLGCSSEEPDPPSPPPPPPPEYGNVMFENWTSEFIDCYIDGDFEGTVDPFDDLTITHVPVGNVSLYAESAYDDWGPIFVTVRKNETIIFVLD